MLRLPQVTVYSIDAARVVGAFFLQEQILSKPTVRVMDTQACVSLESPRRDLSFDTQTLSTRCRVACRKNRVCKPFITLSVSDIVDTVFVLNRKNRV